MLQSYQ